MSLMSELEDLGELMADNLVSMGVSDADASDGLTTLANRILDVPVTTQTLILTTDKTVLSYADSDTLTLTATLIGGTVSGQTIEFFKGSTSLGTATTNSSGVATKTYSSSASGEISFSATKGSVTSEPCQVIDAKYYASDSLISSAPVYNNDRYLFASDYTVQVGDIIHFKFKSLANRMLVGIGSTQGSDFTFEKDGTTLKYWRNVLTNGSYSNPSFMFSTEHETVMELVHPSSSEYRVNLYKDDVYVDYWRCGHSISKIRVDKYFNNNFEIEVYVL